VTIYDVARVIVVPASMAMSLLSTKPIAYNQAYNHALPHITAYICSNKNITCRYVTRWVHRFDVCVVRRRTLRW